MPFSEFHGVYTVDDSGELFSPIEAREGRIQIRTPEGAWASLGAVRFSQSSIENFVHDWATLQARIQKELHLPYLPAIHMRLMWGKNPWRRPTCYKGKRKCKTKNPYLGVPAETTLEWVIEALKIINNYRRSNALIIRARTFNSLEFARNFDQWALEEINHIFQVVGKGSALPFFKVLYSPYLILLTDFLADVQVYENHKRIAVVVDNTEDVTGFEIDSRLVEKQLGIGTRLTFIGKVETLGFDANQFPLLQASDVVAFFYRRAFEGDPFSRNLGNSYLGIKPPKVARRVFARWSRKAIKRHNDQIATRFVLRYQHAYKVAADRGNLKLLKLIVSPDELASRLDRAMSEKKPIAALHVSILRNPLEGREPIAYSYHTRR